MSKGLPREKKKVVRGFAVAVASLALVIGASTVSAAPIVSTVFYEADFATGLPAEITNVGPQNWDVAPFSGPFDVTTVGLTGQWLTSSASGGTRTARLVLTGLPTHQSIDVNVLMGAGGGLDGGADRFIVDVNADNNFEFDKPFAARLSRDGNHYGAPGNPGSPVSEGGTPGVLLAGSGGFGEPGAGSIDYGFRAGAWGHDSVFDLGADPSLDNITHTATTLTIDFTAIRNEGGNDENIDLSNIQIVLNTIVPEPSSAALLGLAAMSIGAVSRRRRRLA